MGFFGKLFGTEKALTDIVESVSSGLDALVYTDEERAQAAASERSEARRMVVDWMEATKGQNLARRLIALSITAVWLSMNLIAIACAMVSVFVHDPARLTRVSALADGASTDMNSAVMLILAFYFAAPHMGDIARAVTGKFVKSSP